MRTIIAGGRDFVGLMRHIVWLDELDNRITITEVVSGGAKGADAFGEQWAELRGVTLKRFPADWNKHGKAAGPIRNAEMAQYVQSDGCVVLFPGGCGTQNMHDTARRLNIPVIDWRERLE